MGWDREVAPGSSRVYRPHKVCPNRRSTTAAGDLQPLSIYQSVISPLVKAHPNAGDQVGGKARKPRIGIVVGGAGFARRRSAKAQRSHSTASTSIYGLAQEVDHLGGFSFKPNGETDMQDPETEDQLFLDWDESALHISLHFIHESLLLDVER